MAPDRIATVVLAAGLSQRFGSDKLLHPFEGKPLAAHIADTLASMSFAHRIAICSAGREELFAAHGFETIENKHPGRGMASSLALGARRAIELDAQAMLVCLADMPFVTSDHLTALIEAEGDVVATEAAGVRSPPAVFGRSLFAQLTQLTGDQGARDFLKSAKAVQAPPGLVRDFDTPADFA